MTLFVYVIIIYVINNKVNVCTNDVQIVYLNSKLIRKVSGKLDSKSPFQVFTKNTYNSEFKLNLALIKKNYNYNKCQFIINYLNLTKIKSKIHLLDKDE